MLLSPVLAFFFFSSRRRHTRLVSDWSSEVCSSDLPEPLPDRYQCPTACGAARPLAPESQIGRASCRERGESWGGALALKKKNRSDTSQGSNARNRHSDDRSSARESRAKT